MRKRGSTLVVVLIIFSALLILGTAVSSAVVNTTKFNAKYSENIDLELAAKSGLNIFKEELISNIKSVSNSSALPLAVAKYDSGITDFKDISITKEILRNDIKENGVLTGYKYTIISTAIDMSNYSSINEAEANNATQKQESQVITVNIDSKGSVKITPTTFINVFRDVTIGSYADSLISNLCYGGNNYITNNGTNQPQKLPSDKIYNLEVKQSEIINIKSTYSLYEYKELSNKDIQIENNNIKVADFKTDGAKLKFSNSNILFEDGWNGSNNNTINKIENSRLFFDNNVYCTELLINQMSNSEFIVNGDFKIQNTFSLGKSYNDYNISDITNNISDITNNIIVVTGDFILPTNSHINLNNSIIIVGGEFNIENGAQINMNNSVIISCGDIIIDTKRKFTNIDKSFIVCGGNLDSDNGIEINNITKNITPDSEVVIEAIEKFLNMNR